MLDVLVILLFSKQIGRWAERKGYRRGLFRGLVIGSWFTGELIGLLGGMFLFADLLTSEDSVYLLIFPILLGAGIGIMTMVIIVGALPFRSRPVAVEPWAAGSSFQADIPPDSTTAAPVSCAPWICPYCGYHNTYRPDRCFNCKKEKPAPSDSNH